MSKCINEFQGLLTNYFRDLVLATAYLKIGDQSVAVAPTTASVSLTLAHDISTEPMYLHELLPHSSAVSHGVCELFQTKTIAAWGDLLNALFERFVTLHVEGAKQYPELKKRATRVDFSSAEDFTLQVRAGLVADFAFNKYLDRIQVINRVLNTEGTFQDELSIIRKHVAIRNAIQHHSGHIYSDMLKELGCNQLSVFDHSGAQLSLIVGESIKLFVPELDYLKSALFRVTNYWRARFA
ncbi:MAG: hypothetical protein ACR2MF_09975 [Chthoniobacterales bacterium]